MTRTHYEVLGVQRSATALQIKAAYRRLVLIHHPDRSADPRSAELFIRITEAYETLSEPLRRASYDRVLEIQESPKSTPPKKPKPQPSPHRSHPSAPQPAPTASPEVLRLTTLLNRGRFVDAENLAKKLIESDPKQPIPYAVLGDLAKLRGNTRRAAEMYAFAAQMDPFNSLYQRKHEELIRGIVERRAAAPEAEFRPTSLIVGLCVIGIAGIYVMFAKESRMELHLELISSWTLGLLLMLFVSGLALGSSMTISGLLQRFGSMQGSAVMKVSPMVALGVVAVVNFWVALGLYFLVGASQNAFSDSSSRSMGGVAAATAYLTLAASVQGRIEPHQVLFWGGNIVYIGFLVGWMVADALRES